MAPRTKEQFEEIRAKSRQAIMASALELFTQRGYHGTSVSMIADRAGVSTGLMYNYFRGKLELLEAIILEGIKLIEATMTGYEEIEDPTLQIKMFVNNAFNMVDEDLDFWTLYFSVLMQPDLPENVKELFSSFIQRIFATLEAVFKQLGYSDPVAEARIFGGILDGVILHYWLVERHYPLERVKKLIIEKYVGNRRAK